MKTLATNNTQ